MGTVRMLYGLSSYEAAGGLHIDGVVLTFLLCLMALFYCL